MASLGSKGKRETDQFLGEMQKARFLEGTEDTKKLPKALRVYSWKVAIIFLMLLLVVGVAGAFFIRAQKISTLKKAKETLKAGTKYYSKGKFDKAIASLENTTRLDPNNSRAQLLLAQSYEAAGNLKEAETAYKTSLDTNPNQPEVLYRLAIIYKSQGKTKEAIRELEKAIKLNKSFVAARLILAELYTQQHQKQKAIKQYQTVIKMKPFGVDLAVVEKKLNNLK